MHIDLNEHITPHFKWKELLYLGEWNIWTFPFDDTYKQNIVDTCEILEQIREIIKSPMKITSGYRPRAYNKHVNGAKESYHIYGLAADFVPTKVPVDKARLALTDFLDDLQCRMHNNKANFIHIDLGVPGASGRFFK